MTLWPVKAATIISRDIPSLDSVQYVFSLPEHDGQVSQATRKAYTSILPRVVVRFCEA